MFSSVRLNKCPGMQEFNATMEAMKDVMASLAQQRLLSGGGCSAGCGGSGVGSALLSNMAWLLGTAGAYAQRTLSKADVAAVFLSRKILLDQLPLQGGGHRVIVDYVNSLEIQILPAIGYLQRHYGDFVVLL